MYSPLNSKSRLQIKLIGVVILAFLVTWIISTYVLVTSIGKRDQMSFEDQINQERLIIEQRFMEAEANLVNAAEFTAHHADLADAIEGRDTDYILQTAESSMELFGHTDVIVTDSDDLPLIDLRQHEGLLDDPQYMELKQQTDGGNTATGILSTEYGVLWVALSPVMTDDAEYVGSVTVATQVDSTLLGDLNFHRSNMALVVFVGENIAGVSADEANGQPHLTPEMVEYLRAENELLAQVNSGQAVTISDVQVRGTPHRVAYEPLLISGEQVGYYVIAVDEGPQQAARNDILTVSSVAVLVTLAWIALMGAYLITQMIIRPIRNLSHTAGRLASGELTARAQVTGSDEIGHLGAAFNHMASKIESRTRQLDDLNHTLEERIEARTAELEQKTAWLEVILRSTSEAVIVTDCEHLVRLINRPALDILNVTEAEALDTSLDTLLARISDVTITWPDDLKGHQSELKVNEQYYHHSISSLSTADSEIAGYVCVLTDITPLRRLDALKTHVIQMAAHDLRSPIMALKLYSTLLQKKADNLHEHQHRTVERMGNTVDDLQQMVTDLLDVEHIERQASGEQDTVMVESLVTSAVSASKGKIETKGHTITVDIEENLPPINGDPVQLLEVIRNLLTNAIKYTPPGGTIQVRAYCDGANVRVEVQDDGIGIDEDDLPKIFQSQFRAKTALASAEDGNGVGLSLAKEVVEWHSGEVWVESQPGQGSTFGFSIPVNPVPVGAEMS